MRLALPFLAGVLGGLLFTVTASCSGAGQACTAASCTGCCDLNDKCQPVTSANACGRGGTTCRACSAGETCDQGVCTQPNTGGGAGGGAMGGGAGGGAMGGGAGGGAMGGGSGGDAGMPPIVSVSTGSCGMVTPCAGNLVGTWFYTSACVDDPLADFRNLCAGISTVSSNSQLSGRLDFTATTVTRVVNTSYTTTINLPASCATLGCSAIQSLLRNTAPTATCVAANGGCNCTLSGTSTLNESGSWSQANGVITVTANGTTRTFDACVTAGARDTLRLRETSTMSATEKGTTTLTRQ